MRRRAFQCHVEPLEQRRLLSATIFTVTSTGDDPSGPTAGIVTLRDAINAVNNDLNDSASSPDVINFQIAGTPVITLSADLTAIDNPVTIDGSTEAGVTVNGKGLAMLVDNSTATVNNVTFTGGTVSLGANGTLTVGTASSLNVSGDLNAGASATLSNFGTVSVSGNVVDAGSIGVFNSPDPATAYAADFTIGGSFTAGDDSYVYNTGTAAFSVAKDFTLGDNSFVYNGTSSTDAATFTVGGSLSVGAADGSSYLDNIGNSGLSVTGNFTLLGAYTYVSNGGPAESATLSVGGNLNLSGASGVYNAGDSTLSVTGNLTLGNNGTVNNGASATDAARLTVDGSFSIGDTSAAANDLGYVYNQGSSTFTVKGDFTIYGQGGSYVYNGTSATDAAILTVGGSFSLGANSFFYEYGSKPFSVSNGFLLGANSYFDDFGTMSVGGNFDPGTGNPDSLDTVGGVFDAGSGSVVTTDTAAWEVVSGGALNITAGGAFTVASGGVLTLDNGASLTDQGNVTVAGALTSSTRSTIVVDYNGQLIKQGTGQLSVQGVLLTWNNPPVNVPGGTVLSATQLDATANVPGTFTYTLADGVTAAAGAVLPAGNGQILNVTFTPADTADYGSASAQASVNVSATLAPTRTTPKLSAPARSTTYTGAAQGYPTSAVLVKGANGLTSSGGTLSFTYNGSATVPVNAGTYTVKVTFTPTDTAEYAVATTTTTWTIKPAKVKLHATSESTTYDGIPQAYPLTGSDVSVTGVSTGTDQAPSGTYSYSYSSASYGPSATPPTKAGRYTVTVTFNTSDPNYSSGATTTTSLNITRATPVITWIVPSAIASSTPLGGSQLDAMASVPGTLVYTPAAGTVLSAGTHTLNVKFTPSDSTDYTDTTATVKLVVLAPVHHAVQHVTLLPGHKQKR